MILRARAFRHHRLLPEATLLLATMIWGLAYLVTRGAVRSGPPLLVVGVRFAVAALVVSLLARPDWGNFSRRELRGGALIALAMVCGYVSQAVAMMFIGSGRTAFINALYVPMVPLLQVALAKPGRRPWPGALAWLAVGISLAGLALMAGPSAGGGFGVGEAWAVFGAGAIAAEILLVAHFAPGVDARRLAAMQCVCVAAMCLGLAYLRGDAPFAHGHAWLAPAVALGCASAFLQVSVNWAMRAVPASRATLIYASEPVWAGGFGAITGERMGLPAMLGAGLILVSLIMPRGSRART